uniref:FRIGIDA-like protein n=1 Tax=Rhizophora mucronata TaxID=61149 RepID=A0A2P2NFE8_RHIMU
MELGLKEKQVQEQVQEAELKNKKILEGAQYLELKEKELEDQRKNIELEGKKFAERIQEFELTKGKFEEQHRDFDLKEKQFVSSHAKVEQPHSCAVNDATDNLMGSNVSVLLKTNGKALQMFLNEHGKDHDSLENVIASLQQSSDPAKLVLDAMQGFYPPHLKNGDVEFEEGVVRGSCILILEQLMKISPEIRPHVAEEAMKLARVWITKMRATSEHSLEVLGFLLLLAVYGLASAFDADELFGYLMIVAQYSQTPELIHVLGFADKINGFIQSLVEKAKRIEAIELIYAFNLVKDFPPEILLKDHLKHYRGKYRLVCRKKHKKSPEERMDATNKRIVAMKAAIKCIEDHGLQSACPPWCLREAIDLLEKEKALLLDQNKKCFDSNFASSHPDHESASSRAPTTSSRSTSLPFSSNHKTRSQGQSGNKRCRLSSVEPRRVSVRSTPNTCSTRPSRQQPSGPFRIQCAPYLATSVRPHGFNGYPPVNIHESWDYNNANPYHPWNSLYDGPMRL